MEIIQVREQEQTIYTLSQVKMINKMARALYNLKPVENRKQLKIIDYCIENNLPSLNYLPFSIEEYAKAFKVRL